MTSAAPPSVGRLFCFGLGYSAGVLARGLLRSGWSVAGTTRSGEAAEPGAAVQAYDREHPLADPAAALAGATHVLVSVPPDAAGDPVLDRHGGDIARLAGVRWVGYLSTTGVYGDRGGALVDESADLRPSGERQRRRVPAETGWHALGESAGLPVHIFRLAGIYGPGRSAFDALRAGTAHRIEKPGLVFSRIHVEDIAAVLRASMARPDPGAVYNVCDDDPAAPAEVVAHAASLLGVEPPPLVPLDAADLSPMARSFYADSRRVDNARIKRELGVRLAYPSYREGLAALLAGGSMADL
jgi:nucleoside-diphosphate-sugar epimerase